MSVAGLRSGLRATGFERLEVSNTILMGVTRVWTRKKARSDPISIMRIARARCCSAAAPIAAKKKFVLDEYSDEATGYMEKNTEGKLAITRVTLRPRLKFSGEKQPTAQEVEEMNHGAHEQCFIANSVKTEITIETQS